MCADPSKSNLSTRRNTTSPSKTTGRDFEKSCPYTENLMLLMNFDFSWPKPRTVVTMYDQSEQTAEENLSTPKSTDCRPNTDSSISSPWLIFHNKMDQQNAKTAS